MSSQLPPGLYTDKDMTVILDTKRRHDWIVPRPTMCAFFWSGLIMLFTGVILLVTSKQKGEVYRSWGAVLLGLGFCVLLICLILCLHAYCVITIIEEAPLGQPSTPPTTVVTNEDKARSKDEELKSLTNGKSEGSSIASTTPPPPPPGKPIQLLIVDEEDVEELEKGKPLYFADEKAQGNNSKTSSTDKLQALEQTATVTHPVLGEVHVSVRPTNPAAFGSLYGGSNFDVESQENTLRKGPVIRNIPIRILDREAEELEPGAIETTYNSTYQRVTIPSRHGTAFRPIRNSTSSWSNQNSHIGNSDTGSTGTYTAYQEGIDSEALTVGRVLTGRPPPIPGRHSGLITAHVVPISQSHYANYLNGTLPPMEADIVSKTMEIREEVIKANLPQNGHQIQINVPEKYTQNLHPDQRVVMYLNPTQNMGHSQLSVYDNVQYVWTEPKPKAGSGNKVYKITEL